MIVARKVANGATLTLEVKGQDTPQDKAKRASLEEWTAAVNEHGGFGRWAWAVSFSPSDLATILAKHPAHPPQQVARRGFGSDDE